MTTVSRNVALATALGILACGSGFARAGQQGGAASKPPAPTAPAASAAPAEGPAANPVDVASMDAILASVYDVISGPAGKKRDWDRMRSLFLPSARMMATGKRPTGEIVHRSMDLEGYISSSGPLIETNGFFERELSRKVETYGQIAHVFSTYEARQKADDPKPFMRGINSFQLFNDGKRWWVVSIVWQSEGPDNPIPEKYLTR
jgi:hypothetical protein